MSLLCTLLSSWQGYHNFSIIFFLPVRIHLRVKCDSFQIDVLIPIDNTSGFFTIIICAKDTCQKLLILKLTQRHLTSERNADEFSVIFFLPGTGRSTLPFWLKSNTSYWLVSKVFQESG